MDTVKMLNGEMFVEMIRFGTINLSKNAKEVNDLNVFPIPDGDTGDNMLMTMKGGMNASLEDCDTLSDVSLRISKGMLLGARGNSGVILSQFFEGFSNTFAGLVSADVDRMKEALRNGVNSAYHAVVEPTEGTILTVMREATEYAYSSNAKTPVELIEAFIEEAKRSLLRTTELLDVLKKAGVVDSGGAGLIYIMEGIKSALMGETISDKETLTKSDLSVSSVNLDLFDENSELKYGYCTELLLRLQRKKCDPEKFDVAVIVDYLKTIGNSVVAFKTGTAVKLHVHTFEPEKVFSFCHQFGEFLTVKVENMTLQHSGTEAPSLQKKERTKFSVVAVANGKGIKDAFSEMGADEIIDGGQSMNPSSKDFIEAFERANADTVFVLPNNGNVILAAKQAAELYKDSEIIVIESKSIGQGYAALSMLNTDSGDVTEITSELNSAMEGVVNVEISKAVKETTLDGFSIKEGDYIGFLGKKVLSCEKERTDATVNAMDAIKLRNYDVCIIISGKGTTLEETEKIRKYVAATCRNTEIFVIEGGQEIYDYIIVAE